VILPDHDITKTGHIVRDICASQQVGPYRWIREIGRGGMGTVYLAMRAAAVFQKRVAINILKRGTDTDAIVQRFRNERQILASLEHPNIASLLDGGTAADGLPYFAMEYVEGQNILDYWWRRWRRRHRMMSTICASSRLRTRSSGISSAIPTFPTSVIPGRRELNRVKALLESRG
jgi:serine/threonine protein kinase